MATHDPVTSADSQIAIGEALYGLVTLAVKNGPREISLTAASTLATLDRTGARRLTDLAVIEGVTQPSMSVLVTGLEAAGLAERRPDPADKRVVLVGLTPAGVEYIHARRRAGAATCGVERRISDERHERIRQRSAHQQSRYAGIHEGAVARRARGNREISGGVVALPSEPIAAQRSVSLNSIRRLRR